MALVPEAVAFSLLAGVSPLTGLYAAFMMGLVTSILGGRPGMISGATGAVAIVLAPLVSKYGMDYLFATVVLAGVIQLLAGFLKLGKFIRLVPQSVMYGFVNGLAIVIFMSQLINFKIKEGETYVWMQGSQLYVMIGLVVLTMLIIWLLPKLTKQFPASLAAILVVFAIVFFMKIDTTTVGDFASIKGGFPDFNLPNIPLSFETLKIILPYALIVAGVGLIESLLTLNLIDDITDTKGSGNREAVAQGAANMLSGVFSGMGGCAMIGQSLINISNGARARLSGIVASVVLLIFIMYGSSLIELVPMSALTGLMIMVSIGTFEWVSFRVFGKMPLHDILVIIIVTLITVIFHNLALAVLVGVVVSALVFAWENAKRIRVRKYVDENGIKHYEIFGPLFFGSVSAFQQKFDVVNDPVEVIIDFSESRISDMSAIDAVNKLTEKYAKYDKIVHLKHLSPDCRKLLENADKLIEVNVMEDPHYTVMPDK